MMETSGWAVAKYGRIDVRTVSDTRRAAIVNWLVVTCGYRILDHHTDEQIEAAWEAQSAELDSQIIEVIISASDVAKAAQP